MFVSLHYITGSNSGIGKAHPSGVLGLILKDLSELLSFLLLFCSVVYLTNNNEFTYDEKLTQHLSIK